MPQPVAEPIAARRERLVLALIALAYVILGTCYAVWTPAWQVPDEPAHFNYLRDIAETGRLPELEPGDYPAEYLEEIKARRFPPEMRIDPIRYEAHQPPLYYIVAATWYRLWTAIAGAAPPLLAIRLLSVALGVGVVLGTYRVAKRAAGRNAGPRSGHIALGAAALVATLPMHVAMTSAVNSDVLAELLLVAVGGAVLGLGPGRWTWRRAAVLGVLLGLAFLTKMQSYVAFAITGLAFVWDAVVRRRDGLESHAAAQDAPLTPHRTRDFHIASDAAPGEGTEWHSVLRSRSRDFVIAFAIMAACVVLLAAPWLIRNMRVYGPSDPFGLGRHAEVVVGQLTTAEYVAANGWGALLHAFFLTTFRSFWGQFGWMGVVLPQRVYVSLGLLSGLVALGFVQWLLETVRGGALTRRRVRALAILATWIAITTAGYLWWNTQYLQHQGRYLFPALAPLGIAFALGLRRLLAGRQRVALAALGLGAAAILVWGLVTGDVKGFTLALMVGAMGALRVGCWVERRWPGVAMGMVYMGMAGLAMYCLFWHIVPALS